MGTLRASEKQAYTMRSTIARKEAPIVPRALDLGVLSHSFRILFIMPLRHTTGLRISF